MVTTALVAIVALAPLSLKSHQEPAQALYDEAGKALDAGDGAQAITLYQQLLQLTPGSIEARTNLGVALAQGGRYDEAAQQYREVLSRDPQNETALLNLALALYKKGDLGTARDELNELHRLHPANQQAFYLLADCDLRLGRYREIIGFVEPAYEAHPEDPALQYVYGTALIQDGQTERGAAVIDRIMRGGNTAIANVLMGAAQYAAGSYKQSTATLRNALDLNPNIPGAWTIYGRALASNGENEEARAAFQHALQADPNDFDACLHLGAILLHDGDATNAETYLNRAVMLRPESAAALFQISVLDVSTGHLDEAANGLEKLVKQWPDFVEAHLQLAVVYARLHRPQDSERERRIVADLNDKVRVKGPQPETLP